MVSKRIICYFFLLLIIFASCTLQKRTHRKGYYLHWNSLPPKIEKPIVSHNKQLSENSHVFNEELLIASNDKTIYLSNKENKKDSVKPVTCGDSLWTKEGNASRVKILEVNDYEIKYKRCANLNGPTISAPKSSVLKIKYSTGEVESYQANAIIENSAIPSKQRPNNTVARTGLTCSLFFILALCLSIVFGVLEIWILTALFSSVALVLYLIALVITCRALLLTKRNPKIHLGAKKAKISLAILVSFWILLTIGLIIAIFLALAGAGG